MQGDSDSGGHKEPLLSDNRSNTSFQSDNRPVTVSDIYKMSIRQLKDLFKDRSGQHEKLKEYG